MRRTKLFLVGSQFYPDFIHDFLSQRSCAWLHFPCKIQRRPHQRLFFIPHRQQVPPQPSQQTLGVFVDQQAKKKKKYHSHLGLGAN